MQTLLAVCTPVPFHFSRHLCQPFTIRHFSASPRAALLPQLAPGEEQDTTTPSGLLIQLHVEKLIDLRVTEGKVIDPSSAKIYSDPLKQSEKLTVKIHYHNGSKSALPVPYEIRCYQNTVIHLSAKNTEVRVPAKILELQNLNSWNKIN